jgi:hypothetical protein
MWIQQQISLYGINAGICESRRLTKLMAVHVLRQLAFPFRLRQTISHPQTVTF